MLKKLIFYILIFNFLAVSAQLNQEPKKITNKFFSELNDLENITPALKKKKGFTNYEELIDFIAEKVKKYPESVSSNFIGESQKQKKIPIIYIKKKNHNDEKKLKVWMQGGLHGNEPASTESLLYLIHLILEDSDYNYLLN
ncbi:MAG: peptidase, partial [Flavobacteriaceae bacterium]|nr:peptidase [Flavobacteriaceae bacterium]